MKVTSEGQKPEAAMLAAPTMIKLTGKLKQRAGWKTPDEIQPGDAVTDELYWAWLEALPPATHHSDLMQMGEAMDHGAPGNRPRFLTLQLHAKQWIYTGVRAQRERVQFQAP